MNLINSLFNFVILIISKYNIDESHGIKHSMDVLHYAFDIYTNEVINYPELKNQERIIYIAAIIHDMCDKKYMDEQAGLNEIEKFLKLKIPQEETDITKQIISTMSYSTVKKKGYPNLNKYQIGYHIVREADLLSAYDFDRCMIYQINKNNGTIETSFNDAELLFNNRVFKHFEDNLFFTDYSKKIAQELHINALKRIKIWKKIIKNPIL